MDKEFNEDVEIQALASQTDERMSNVNIVNDSQEEYIAKGEALASTSAAAIITDVNNQQLSTLEKEISNGNNQNKGPKEGGELQVEQ